MLPYLAIFRKFQKLKTQIIFLLISSNSKKQALFKLFPLKLKVELVEATILIYIATRDHCMWTCKSIRPLAYVQ
jgi:hypothetical protein